MVYGVGVAEQTGRSGPGVPDESLGPQGAKPQRLFMTLLGEYWHGRDAALPAGALVALAGEFGIAAAGARIAARRLADRGVLVTERDGRRVGYRLNPHLRSVFDAGHERVMRFGRPGPAWDGTWTVVTFSLPEASRDVRHMLRSRLRWLGLAPRYDGVWCCPRDRTAEVAAVLAQLDVRNATVLTARIAAGSPAGGDPLAAWDLDSLRARYEGFLARWEPLEAAAVLGNASAAALVSRTELTDAWREFPDVDPDLPAELLPAGWPLERAAAAFHRLHDALGPAATGQFDDLVDRFAPADQRASGRRPGPSLESSRGVVASCSADRGRDVGG